MDRDEQNPAPDSSSDIAVIGMACRFPGAAGLDQYWRNLREGVESVCFFRDEELIAEGVPPALLEAPNYVRAHAALDGYDLFDAGFFGYSPREAEVMDPQQRLFLECAWEALEHAGYDATRYPGLVSVYGGASMSSYLLQLSPLQDKLEAVGVDTQMLGIGNDKDSLACRVAYKLNLRGPAMSVQTACSTSLVAVHLACQSLLTQESDMALAGAVSITTPMKRGYLYQEEGILSPDGHNRAFDARAAGTVFGCGLGIVVLKRLADAQEDGDTIHAVIKGSALNNDGSSKVGFTAPSVSGQAEVIAEALANAGLPAESIHYLEAHGTATAMGDPVEIEALTRAFRRTATGRGFCAIGSSKSNFGHLEVAAGIAGLIKAVLAIEHAEIPPTLHFSAPNPRIDFANSPFYVNTELAPWPDGPRRAGVSSFGFGGTNSHVVLEEAPPVHAAPADRPWQLLVLSARSEAALTAATANLARYLAANPEVELADVAYTLQLGRRPFEHRRAIAARDAADAREALGDRFRLQAGVADGRDRQVCFLFPGQGAQHVAMARDVYLHEPVFRAELERCAALFRELLGLDILRYVDPPTTPDGELLVAGGLDALSAEINRTEVAQPALFSVEYALARLWQSWGVVPQAMAGHSLGEYVAACLAGVFSLEDATRLVAARARLMGELPPGDMLAIPLPEEQVLPLLDEELALSAVHGPEMCVVSGPAHATGRLFELLAARGVESRGLHTSHAFHSAMMDPVLAPFEAEVRRITLRPPRIPFASNLTGRLITPVEATDPAYWRRHIRETVRLMDCLGTLLGRPGAVLLEVGPAQALAGAARQHPARNRSHAIHASLPHPKDPRDGSGTLVEAVGGLWLAGVPVDWEAFNARPDGRTRRRIPLPSYPFERQRHWIDAERLSASADRAAAYAPAALKATQEVRPAAPAAPPAAATAPPPATMPPLAPNAATPANTATPATPLNTASAGPAPAPTKAASTAPPPSPAASQALTKPASGSATDAAAAYVAGRYGHGETEIPVDYLPPANDIEEILVDMWQTLLGVARVGVTDNFFRLNGNSLIALQAISRIQSVFGVKLAVRAFFETPTVAQLAAIIAERQPGLEALTARAQIVDEIQSQGAQAAETPAASAETAGTAQETAAAPQPAGASPTVPTVPAGATAPAAVAAYEARHHDVSGLAGGLSAGLSGGLSGANGNGHSPMAFSIFFFSGNESMFPEYKYKLIIDGAKFADRNGFTAIWTPERHFHSFGGLYPNPSVLSAGIAMVTERLQVRAGSVVMALHNPIRVAEEWSIVDNLSRGRVGISFASGFHPDDFTFSPDAYSDRRDIMFSKIDTMRKLWRGEKIEVLGGAGNMIDVEIFPKPVQPEVPIWITCSNSPDTFERTGAIGANVLTSMIGLTLDHLEQRIALYRDSRARHGHDPKTGQVAIMVHTFVGTDLKVVKEKVRGPFCDYLRSHTELLASLARSLSGGAFDSSGISREDLEDLLMMEFERYFHTGSLLGTPESCLEMVRKLREIGVDECGCLLDFGVDVPSVMDSLQHLATLRTLAEREVLVAG